MYNQIESNKRRTALLIIFFMAFIIFIGYVFNRYFNFGPETVTFAVIISVVMSLVSYYNGDRIALWSTGAEHISKEDNPYVYRLVENLCISAGMPVPKIHIINSPALNAFATGRDPNHASIALTSGIIQALENEELEGVIAHELSHIKNYDVRLMTVVVVLVGIISILADWFLRARFFGVGMRRRDRAGESNQLGAVLMIFGIVLIIFSPILAQLIQLAISRRREYLADASGSLLTRYPEGLARALEKISASPEKLRTANSATAYLFISNPFKSFNASALFSTHPPITERIKRLREMV